MHVIRHLRSASPVTSMAHMTQVNNSQLVSTAEAAAALQMSRSQVARLARAGRLEPAAKAPGPRGAYLFQRGDVERLKAEGSSC